MQDQEQDTPWHTSFYLPKKKKTYIFAGKKSGHNSRIVNNNVSNDAHEMDGDFICALQRRFSTIIFVFAREKIGTVLFFFIIITFYTIEC